MEKTIRLYIGADNRTGKVGYKKLENYLLGIVEGYTIIESRGCWKGGQEASCIVEICDKFHNEKTVIAFAEGLCKDLCKKLKQDSVGYTVLPSINFITK